MFTRIYDLLFHRHHWTLLNEVPLYDKTHEQCAKGFLLQCTKCGNIKYKRIYF